LLSLPASAAAIVGPMLSPMLAPRLGLSQSVAGLLAVAAIGFAVQILVGTTFAVVAVAVGWALWAMGGSAAATLTTGTVISSARPERAGAVSALAQTGAELGGALGIAVLGSLGTLIYRGSVAAAIPAGLAPDLAATARDTVGGALEVASQLADPAAAAALASTAQHALTTAVEVTSAIAAVVSILSALGVALWFRAGETRSEPDADAPVSPVSMPSRDPDAALAA
jgi:DHA2 family multidrug resistance protein-like MFS transporter